MSEANHQDKLAHISQVLLQLSLGSAQDTAFHRKASTTRLLALLWGDGDNNAWWEQERDTEGVYLYDGIQLENVRALKSFMNHKQNKLGPVDTCRIDILNLTAEDFDHFIGYWDGHAVNYDEAKAILNLQSRHEHMARCRGQESPSRPNRRDNNNVNEDDQEERDRTRDEWNVQRDVDREETKRLREEEKDLKNWSAVRREISSFPKLEQDQGAIAWKREWEAVCKAQQVEFMLVGEYDPDVDTERLGMKDKFKIAQALIYAALLKSVNTSMGKSIVVKNTDDGLKAYAEIIDYYFGASSHACVAADKLRKAIKTFDVPVTSRRDKEAKDYFRDFLDMISDYQESAPKDKKFSANEIDNLYDDLILKFPDLKYVGSLINMNKIDGRTYTPEQKIEQYMRAAELDVSFNPPGPTSRRINEHQTNPCESYAEDGEAYSGLSVHQMESVDNHNVNDYVYDDGIPDHPMLSIFRTNHTDPSTGKETREFRLPMSLWKNMTSKDKSGWISITQSGRANIIEYFTSPATNIKGNGDDTNVRDKRNHRRISKTRTLARKAPSARPVTQSLHRDPRNVEFTQVDEVIETDGGEETAEDSIREVRMSRMSLVDAIREPSIEEEPDIKLAIGNSNVESNDLLYILSDDNVDNTARASLQDVYGGDEYPKPSRLKATINSLKNNPLKKKSQRKINMVRADDPPKVDNNAEARSIRVHHTESSGTYAEILADEIRSRGTFEGGLSIGDQDRKRGILDTEETHSPNSPTTRGTLNGGHMVSPTGFTDDQPHPDSMKDANNLGGKYPMQPADGHPQDHLLSSQSCYQVLNFDKVIDFSTIDRGANHDSPGCQWCP